MAAQLPPLLALLAAAVLDAPASSAPVDVRSSGAAATEPPAAVAPHFERDELPVRLTWVAPPECPGTDVLRTEIQRVAGSSTTPEQPLAAHGTVRRGPGGSWQLTLITHAGEREGERHLAAPDCDQLLRAAALVVALMINPAAGEMAAAPRPPPPPTPPLPPPIPAAATEAVASVPSPRSIAIGAEILFGTGALPGVASGVGVRAAIGQGHFAAEARGAVWAERTTARAFDSQSGGAFRLWDLGLGACGRAWDNRRLSPALCPGISIARLQGTGYGVSDPGRAVAWWTAATLDASVRLRVTSRNAVRLGAQVLASLGRPNFALAGLGPIYRPDLVWIRGTIGWLVTF